MLQITIGWRWIGIGRFYVVTHTGSCSAPVPSTPNQGVTLPQKSAFTLSSHRISLSKAKKVSIPPLSLNHVATDEMRDETTDSLAFPGLLLQ